MQGEAVDEGVEGDVKQDPVKYSGHVLQIRRYVRAPAGYGIRHVRLEGQRSVGVLRSHNWSEHEGPAGSLRHTHESSDAPLGCKQSTFPNLPDVQVRYNNILVT